MGDGVPKGTHVRVSVLLGHLEGLRVQLYIS